MPAAKASNSVIADITTDKALREAELGASRMLIQAIEGLSRRMDAFGSDLGEIKTSVTTMQARAFDVQIAELKTEADKREEKRYQEMEKIYDRLRLAEGLLLKYGLALAIVGSISTLAAGSVITVLIMKLLG